MGCRASKPPAAASSESSEAPPAPPTHFILLQHGSHGRPDQLHFLKKHCEALFGPVAHVWSTDVNAKRRTDDGTIACGLRLWGALKPALAKFASEYREYERTQGVDATDAAPLYFSCVAHSFGGILLREVVHLCAFDADLAHFGIRFHTFATLATPHLGVSDLHPTLKKGASIIGNWSSTTYLELLLERDTLYTTLIDDAHIAALAKFEQRLLFANTYDHLVPLPSASLRFDLDAQLFQTTDAKDQAPRFRSATAAHPHVLVDQDGVEFPVSRATDHRVSADADGTAAGVADQQAVVIRDRLLAAGPWRLFPTHFAFRGFPNISHAYIVGMGACRGKHCQDVSHFVASQIADLHLALEKARCSGSTTPDLEREVMQYEDRCASTTADLLSAESGSVAESVDSDAAIAAAACDEAELELELACDPDEDA